MFFLKLTQIRYFCKVLSFLFFISSFAQNKETNHKDVNRIPDHIKSFIKKSDSVQEINSLISKTLSEDKDSALAIAYSELFLERGKKEKDYNIQYLSSYQLAYIEYIRSNYLATIKNTLIATEAAEKLKDTSRIIDSNVLLGSAYYLIGAYDNALQPYIRGKELSKTIGSFSYEIICLTNIANSRMKLHRYKDALTSFNLILETLENENDDKFIQYKETYLSSLLGKGKCLTELNESDRAIATYNQGVRLSEENNLLEYKSYFYINFGDIYFKKQEYHKALGFLKEGKDILNNISGGQQTNLYIANFYMSRCYFKLENYQEAISLLNENFSLIGDRMETDKIEDMFQLAIEISKATSNQEQQIFYYDKLQKVIQYKSDKQLKAKDILYEDDLKDFQLENEKLESEKTQNATSKKVILFISIISLGVLFSVFLGYRRKTKIKEQKFLTIIENIHNKKSLDKPKEDITKPEIEDEKAKEILNRLQQMEATHFYLSEDCNLYSTAKLLNTNTTYLSKALNETRKQSFNQYINELRVNYALLKLRDDSVFRSYTIRAVAKELGYKSHTTFIKVFKGKTGVNPAYYINKLERSVDLAV
ncbi:helix-turn-helix domain-containing protein [Aquimarina sp. 2201CG14-23]|uniref:helix-turn-helix domain-containing protein n=1 Tax=Aquimarina mycalae TaxID=3040073 RepID=UPI002477D707|nr:helix-turn-helix domain-containing protein [Aquimarina sp. 2201CG14-23]MDH7444154.1 helix-turn-helix domain-containing protein [Aquimarina sp. 2201CG14-23]